MRGPATTPVAPFRVVSAILGGMFPLDILGELVSIGTLLAFVLVSIGLGILCYEGRGNTQFGFRYAQDLYPMLLLLTVRGLRGRISFEAWIAIGVSAGRPDGVGAPGVGVRPGTPMNRGGPVNRAGRR